MRYFFLILVICLFSCRTRYVNTDISKSSTQVKTEQSSKVTEQTTVFETDKSVQKDSISDKSETYETDSSTVTADKITFENGKIKEATGNVKVKNKVNTRKSNNIQSTGSKQADKVTKTTFDKDSVGSNKSEQKTKTKVKTKDVEVKSTIGLYWLLLIPVIAACGYIWYRVKK